MADQDGPGSNARKSRAEQERWRSEENSVRNADRDENPDQLYDRNDDKAGGITNRPLDQEIGNQESLPERGTSRNRTGNPDATRREGDYSEDSR